MRERGALAHGAGHVRRRQHRTVVDAVAHHQHAAALRAAVRAPARACPADPGGRVASSMPSSAAMRATARGPIAARDRAARGRRPAAPPPIGARPARSLSRISKLAQQAGRRRRARPASSAAGGAVAAAGGGASARHASRVAPIATRPHPALEPLTRRLHAPRPAQPGRSTLAKAAASGCAECRSSAAAMAVQRAAGSAAAGLHGAEARAALVVSVPVLSSTTVSTRGQLLERIGARDQHAAGAPAARWRPRWPPAWPATARRGRSRPAPPASPRRRATGRTTATARRPAATAAGSSHEPAAARSAASAMRGRSDCARSISATIEASVELRASPLARTRAAARPG